MRSHLNLYLITNTNYETAEFTERADSPAVHAHHRATRTRSQWIALCKKLGFHVSVVNNCTYVTYRQSRICILHRILSS
eukprot:6178466-Pleurochrysis_carterae.AAC.3